MPDAFVRHPAAVSPCRLRLATGLCAVALAVLAGCGSDSSPAGRPGASPQVVATDAADSAVASGEVRLLDERAWGIAGAAASGADVPLVLRVAVGEGALSETALLFETDDGTPLTARLFRVGIDDTLPPKVAARWRAFLGPLGRWSAEPLLPGADSGELRERFPRGSWVAVITLPPALPRFISPRLTKGGEARCDLQALDVSGLVIARGRRALDSAAARVASAIGPAAAGDAARLLARADSPLERWRTGPMLRALAAIPGGAIAGDESPAGGASGETGPVGRVRIERDEVDALEALARQATARWQAGLGTLALADAALADRVAERLLLFVRAPATSGTGGRSPAVPVWPGEESGVAALLAGLLGEGAARPAGPAGATERATEWLSALPEYGAWIMDDSGSVDPASGRPRAAIGTLNLADRPAIAFAEDAADASRTAGAAELAATPARSIASVAGVLAPTLGAEPARLRVRIGSRLFERPVNATPVSAGPGIGLGPLKPDLDMPTWLATCAAPSAESGGGPAADPAWSCAATLLRRAAPGPSATREWVLYIESTRPDDAAASTADASAPPSPDEVRVWLGPYFGTDRPAALVFTVPERGPCTMTDPFGTITTIEIERVTREGRWSAWVPIPARAIDRDQRLRIGLERTDPRGLHTGWPRAMTPWQGEPARAVLDLSGW